MNMVSAIKADRQIAGTAAVEMRGITKIFGPRPEEALELLRQGRSKAEVQAETGHVIGLQDVSLSIARGQIYVVMGLSGSGKSTLVRHVNRLIDPTAGDVFVGGEVGPNASAAWCGWSNRWRRKDLATARTRGNAKRSARS